MIIKKYMYRTEFYSCFLGHNKYEYHEFDTLSDALKSYHDDLAHDFDYEDAYHSTHPVIYYFKYIDDPVTRPHARSRFEWEKICEAAHHDERKSAILSDEELEEAIAGFMSFLENCEDNDDVLV